MLRARDERDPAGGLSRATAGATHDVHGAADGDGGQASLHAHAVTDSSAQAARRLHVVSKRVATRSLTTNCRVVAHFLVFKCVR